MILVVRHESGEGKKLEVVISDDKNIVVEKGSCSIEIDDTNKLIITSKLVQKILLDAIGMGWKATELGPPVECKRSFQNAIDPFYPNLISKNDSHTLVSNFLA